MSDSRVIAVHLTMPLTASAQDHKLIASFNSEIGLGAETQWLFPY